MDNYKFYIITGKIFNTNETYIFINSIKNINMIGSLHNSNNSICASNKFEYFEVFSYLNLPINNKSQANILSSLIASIFKYSYPNIKVYHKLTANYHDDLKLEEAVRNFDFTNNSYIKDSNFCNCFDIIINYFIKNKIVINKQIVSLKIPLKFNYNYSNNKYYYYDKDDDIIMQS